VLGSPEQATVMAAIPKFKTEYSVELASILSAMGMSSAFDPDSADFSRIGDSPEGNIHITSVLHKTYIAVDERGTKAGAVTSVAVGDSMAPPMEIKEIYLDRPFVYMLIDCENNIPFFIGTMMDMKN
jgi:serpin B